ncbi:Heterogeneous nuclear ribonucleoprotein A1 [Plecturocebus cupreus]
MTDRGSGNNRGYAFVAFDNHDPVDKIGSPVKATNGECFIQPKMSKVLETLVVVVEVVLVGMMTLVTEETLVVMMALVAAVHSCGSG